ncbi:hypothetical protein DL988_23685 [Shigella flexneri]|nr:hypothetical protein [Shigella flexneri]
MNIAKQKEIIRLRKEIIKIQEEYIEKKVAYEEQQKAIYFDSAVKLFNDYLQKEGFKVTTSEYGGFQAELEGIVITFSVKPNILSVRMPNGENYDIMIRNLAHFNPYMEKSIKDQDAEISYLKKEIATFKERLDNVEKNQQIKYALLEENNRHGRLEYDKKHFHEFNKIIELMFS